MLEGMFLYEANWTRYAINEVSKSEPVWKAFIPQLAVHLVGSIIDSSNVNYMNMLGLFVSETWRRGFTSWQFQTSAVKENIELIFHHFPLRGGQGFWGVDDVAKGALWLRLLCVRCGCFDLTMSKRPHSRTHRILKHQRVLPLHNVDTLFFSFVKQLQEKITVGLNSDSHCTLDWFGNQINYMPIESEPFAAGTFL